MTTLNTSSPSGHKRPNQSISSLVNLKGGQSLRLLWSQRASPSASDYQSNSVLPAEVEALLDQTDCGLREVLNWQVGTYLPLSVMPESKVALRCGKLHVFNGFMGRKGTRVAVRIEDRLISDGKRD